MIETDALGAGRGTLVLFLGKSLNLFFSLILFLSQFFFFFKVHSDACFARLLKGTSGDKVCKTQRSYNRKVALPMPVIIDQEFAYIYKKRS